LCLYAVGHDSKPRSSENLRLHAASKTKESLNATAAESSCFVSVGSETPVEHHVSAVISSSSDRQLPGLQATHCAAAVVEPTPTGALLRPTLTLSRKGHGHRHRRAMRRASSGVSCGMPLSLVEVDPREPQVVLSESALLSTQCSSNSCGGPVEAVALQTFGTSRATVASPAHSDLSSLSSYKETSPESEAAAPLHVLKLDVSCPCKINLTETRRRSENRLSSLSRSRDSLEMYKNRSQRKLSVDGMLLSESAIVHAVAEPSSSASVSADVMSANSAEHVIETEIASTSLHSSDNECSATVSDRIQPENDSSNISMDRLSLSSIAAATSCDDVSHQVQCGSSPTDCQSESSNTLTPATDISSSTVRKRAGKNGRTKSAASSSSSRKLSSLFCGVSTNDGEIGEDVVSNAAVEASRADSAAAALDWLFSTDSEESPSSGTWLYLLHIKRKFSFIQLY